MNKSSFVLGLTLLCFVCTKVAIGKPRHEIPKQKYRITDENQLSEITQKVTSSLQKLSEQENKAFELIRVLSATFQVNVGILYEIKAEIKGNDKASTCAISYMREPWKNIIKFDVDCGEKRKYQYISEFENPVTEAPVIEASNYFSKLGGFSKLPADQLTQLHTKLTPVFTKLGMENIGFDWRVKRVMDAESQIVAGIRYICKIELENEANETKTCEADIWERGWEKFILAEIQCQDKNYRVTVDD